MTVSDMVLNSVKFTLNPIYRWPSKRAKNWLQKFLAHAETNPNIVSVVAIGSSVRENVCSADLDLVVLVDEKPIGDVEPPPIDVDLRIFKACEVTTLVREGNDLLGWSIKFGKPLLDKNDSWLKIVRTLDSEVPLPSAKTALERAHKANDLLKLLIEIGDLDAIHEQLLTLLTQLSRARLINRGVYPISRPELAEQLETIDENKLAALLKQTLTSEESPMVIYKTVRNFAEFQSVTQAN